MTIGSSTKIDYYHTLCEVLESSKIKFSTLKPSEWAERNLVMGKPFPGPFSYRRTPYTQEIVDCLAADNPARTVAVMGSAQWGKTAGIIIPGIGFIINNDPGPIIMTVGHEDLMESSMEKVDWMLDSTGTRRLIKSGAQRAKNQKTGDTNTRKEFPGGFYKLSPASNPKIWREVSYKYGFIDDFDAVKGKTKIAGGIRELIEKRFNSFDKTRKIFYISSPELSDTSNILEVYLKGDQRKFFVPCPCCGTGIELVWETIGQDGGRAGITWAEDENGDLDEKSVCYTCQECGGRFSESGNTYDAEGNEEHIRNKIEWINAGSWRSTAKPSRPDFYSYHMSGLYSPPGMADWISYVYKWREAHPKDGKRIEAKYQAFLNLDLGLPYTAAQEEQLASGNDLQANSRPYSIGIIPEALSIADGNGKIVLLTLAADMNGTEHDARVDWELLAHSENLSTYSVMHGSIGTFIRKENQLKHKEDRERWSYQHGQQNCVWDELEKILGNTWLADNGRKMKISAAAYDSGQFTMHVYAAMDRSNHRIVCMKGAREEDYQAVSRDLPIFRPAKERAGLYILETGRIKDRLAEYMRLKNNHETQPENFMNFPEASNGLYGYKNYYCHFEAEHRMKTEDRNGAVKLRWTKKTSTAQNHFWDVRVYGLALREIVIKMIAKDLKDQAFDWEKYCALVTGR